MFYSIVAPCSCERTGYLEYVWHGYSRAFTVVHGEGIWKQKSAKSDQEARLGLVSVGAWHVLQLFVGDATAHQQDPCKRMRT